MRPFVRSRSASLSTEFFACPRLAASRAASASLRALSAASAAAWPSRFLPPHRRARWHRARLSYVPTQPAHQQWPSVNEQLPRATNPFRRSSTPCVLRLTQILFEQESAHLKCPLCFVNRHASSRLHRLCVASQRAARTLGLSLTTQHVALFGSLFFSAAQILCLLGSFGLGLRTRFFISRHVTGLDLADLFGRRHSAPLPQPERCRP